MKQHRKLLLALLPLFALGCTHRSGDKGSGLVPLTEWQYLYNSDTVELGLNLASLPGSSQLDFTLNYYVGRMSLYKEGTAKLVPMAATDTKADSTFLYEAEDMNFSFVLKDNSRENISFRIYGSKLKDLYNLSLELSAEKLGLLH